MGIQTIRQMEADRGRNMFRDEVKIRKEMVARLLFTGVKPIDFVFRGIMPNDLVLVGAASGSGKTSLLAQMAMNIASDGKHVYMFALEAARGEIHQRIKFRVYSEILWEKDKLVMNYADWIRFKYAGKIDHIEAEGDPKLDALNEFLHIKYRESTFDLQDFIKLYHLYSANASLVMADHVQFFDFDETKTNDNSFTKDLTLKMYDLVNQVKVPIVLVSHLRKLENEDVMPTIYDFHGSSELSKKATKVLLLKRGDYDEELGAWATVFNFVKNRELDPKVVQAFYKTDRGRYGEDFKVGKIIRNKFQVT